MNDTLELRGRTVIVTGASSGIGADTARALHDTTIEQLDLGEFHQVLDLNLVSVIRLMQAVLPSMLRQGFGRIVNISSGTTGMVLPGIRAYAATKSAVNMLSAVARKELEGTGVSVSVVLPSTTATEFGAGRFTSGRHTRPGFIAHSSDYGAGIILRALRTGEERIDIPHGNEQPELAGLPTH